MVASLAQRTPYALSPENTRVTLSVRPVTGQRGDTLLVTVRVRYRYFMIIPFAGRLFGTSYPGSGFLGGYYYREMERSYTLPVMADELFPESQHLQAPQEAGTQ